MRLRVRPAAGRPFVVTADGPTARIGRSVHCELRIDDPYASRIHAELVRDDGAVTVEDLASGNGTFLNGERVEGRVAVGVGDLLQIGNTRIRLLPADGSGDDDTDPETYVARPWATRGEPPGDTDRSLESVVAAVREITGSLEPGVEAGAAGADREGAVQDEDAAAPRDRQLFDVVSQIGASFLSPAPVADVLEQVLDLIFGAVAAERAYLMLQEGPEGRLVCRLASFRDRAVDGAAREARISRRIVDEVIARGRSVLSSNAQEDIRFAGRQSIVRERVRSIMAVPLPVGQRRLGMIYVDSPIAEGAFVEDDLRLLKTLASFAAIKIENAFLLEQQLENARIRQQLASARKIQQRLLPTDPPVVSGYHISGFSLPSGEVGGDLFDFVPRGDGRWLIVVGDISGKGMDAALLMSSLHASLRTEAESGLPVAELVGRVNRYLEANSPANRFATLFVADFDAASDRLRYVSAGHNPALVVRRAGEVQELSHGGLPLGIDRDTVYEATATALAPGDVLLVYSDGVSEAADAEGVELGTERLVETVRRHPDASAEELERAIRDVIRAHVPADALEDDATLVIVRRTG